jgi:peptidoglycan/LPS O-acetylase OafA/YrhL
MIQRIQTVWLLLLAIISAIWTFHFTANDGIATFVLKAGSGIAGIAALVAIFLYKKRKTQLKVCYGILAVWMAVSITLWVRDSFFNGLLYFSCLLTDVMAIYAIHKDEKLVRSTDRLR